jgi:GT2 family glycosyltransferase
MEKIDISIVIVNYNVKDFLYKCLTSVRNASQKLSVETIVVDNDSKDGSLEFLQPKFPEVQFIALKENIGFGRANNLGFEKAKGKYILILNPDTILEESTLDVMKEYMDKNPDTGISGCKVLNDDGTFQLACRRGFPTPWAALTKLTGLQSLFPKSKLFAQYNQTYRSQDETYEIDAVIGAFMFARRDVIERLNGFDPEFFMYGEDIDLCFRTKKLGYSVDYVHSTSIIHFKGESTKRSTINDVKHFYEAMKIFASKHYGKSSFFLTFLKLGIFLRSIIAYLSKYSREIFIILVDLLIVNAALLSGTYFRFGSVLGFPEHAYPIVFIAVSLIIFFSMFFSGEYFESEHKITKSTFGYLISFFVLSSLTYFFKQYAFSRGVVLWTIGFSIIFSSFFRILISAYDNSIGKKRKKNLLIVGFNENTIKLIEELISKRNTNINFVGYLTIDESDYKYDSSIPNMGNYNSINDIITKNNIDEVIITENKLRKSELIRIISDSSDKSVKFHVASEYEELIASELLDEITGEQPGIKKYNIAHFRFVLLKRLFDVFGSVFLLTAFLPFTLFISIKEKHLFRKLLLILISKMTFVGTVTKNTLKKESIISLAKLVNSGNLKPESVKNIDEHYLQNYSLSLDLEILYKYLIRKNNGKSNTRL